jgi:ribosomal protein S17E
MGTHAENLELYLLSGGDPKVAKLHKIGSIQNRSRIIYLLSKLEKNTKTAVSVEIESPEHEIIKEDPVFLKPEVPKLAGLITQYPAELHPVYHELEYLWSKFCELKLELNAARPEHEKKAFGIQTKIFQLFEKFDKNKKILDHYIDYKHILPIESKRNFDKMTQLQLDQERRNIATLICRRQQTIKKMEEQLPEETDPAFNKKLSSLNHKKEQLQELILDQEKIIQLLHS